MVDVANAGVVTKRFRSRKNETLRLNFIKGAKHYWKAAAVIGVPNPVGPSQPVAEVLSTLTI